MEKVALSVLLLVTAASAESLEDELRPKITATRYPPLAEMARIQGDVRLKFNSGAVTVLSGHPLLATTATESSQGFSSILGPRDFEVTYHFVFADTAARVHTLRTIERGNAFERALMRMFGLKTERVVDDYRCEEVVAPPNDFRVAGNVIEIWIYGKTFCGTISTAPAMAAKH